MTRERNIYLKGRGFEARITRRQFQKAIKFIHYNNL